MQRGLKKGDIMEGIAVLSDVHGNITALNAVLDDIRKGGIGNIY